MGEQDILNRGKKWFDIRARAEIRNQPDDQESIKWIASQEAIQADITAYENSLIKPKAEPKKPAKKA